MSDHPTLPGTELSPLLRGDETLIASALQEAAALVKLATIFRAEAETPLLACADMVCDVVRALLPLAVRDVEVIRSRVEPKTEESPDA